MYRQVVQPSTLTNCRDQRSEDNLEYDYIYGQATEAQSNRYYGVALKITGVDSYRHCCASGPKYPILTEEKVERYQDQVLEESTDPRCTNHDWYYCHPTMSKNEKAWYRRLGLPGIFGSAQLSAIRLIISCQKC